MHNTLVLTERRLSGTQVRPNRAESLERDHVHNIHAHVYVMNTRNALRARVC